MSTVTGTVTVNAAFLQEIKEDNRELRRLIMTASGMFAEQSNHRGTARQRVDVLGQLRDQLAMHFSLEEAYGYFDDAVDVAPRLSEQAEALRNEHETLFRTMCNLVESAERLLYRETPGGAIRSMSQSFATFRHQFHDHEARENELILQSLDDDIGVGD